MLYLFIHDNTLSLLHPVYLFVVLKDAFRSLNVIQQFTMVVICIIIRTIGLEYNVHTLYTYSYHLKSLVAAAYKLL